MPFGLTLEHTNTESSCCSCRVPVHVIYQFERTNPRGLQTVKINLLMPFFVLLNGSLWRYSEQVWSGRCSTVFQSFTPQSLLRHVNSPSQSEVSKENGLLLPPTIYFPKGHQVVVYIFFLVFASLLSFPYLPFNNVFLKAVPSQDSTNPVSFSSSYFMQDTPIPLDFM